MSRRRPTPASYLLPKLARSFSFCASQAAHWHAASRRYLAFAIEPANYRPFTSADPDIAAEYQQRAAEWHRHATRILNEILLLSGVTPTE